MLPKKKRVTKEIFQTIMDKGNIVYGSFFVLRYLPSGLPSYAFAISKKIAKKAVQRNKMRRLGYNILRKYVLTKGSAVFLYKKEGLRATTLELTKDIDLLLKRSKILE